MANGANNNEEFLDPESKKINQGGPALPYIAQGVKNLNPESFKQGAENIGNFYKNYKSILTAGAQARFRPFKSTNATSPATPTAINTLPAHDQSYRTRTAGVPTATRPPALPSAKPATKPTAPDTGWSPEGLARSNAATVQLAQNTKAENEDARALQARDIDIRRAGNAAAQNEFLAMPDPAHYGGRGEKYARDMAAWSSQVVPKIDENRRAEEESIMNKFFQQKYGVNLQAITAQHTQAQTEKELAEAAKDREQGNYYRTRAAAPTDTSLTKRQAAILHIYNSALTKAISDRRYAFDDKEKDDLDKYINSLHEDIGKIVDSGASDQSAGKPTMTIDKFKSVARQQGSKMTDAQLEQAYNDPSTWTKS